MGADYKRGQVWAQLIAPVNAVAGNATNYIFVRVIGFNLTFPEYPFDVEVSRLFLRIDNPPGAGETFEATIMSEAGATTVTVTIGGAVDTRGQDLVNAEVIPAGNKVSLRCVTSLNCPNNNIGASWMCRRV